MLTKINNEKLAHNIFFLILLAITPFIGYLLDNPKIAYYGIIFSIIIKLYISCDIRLFLQDIILCFIVTRTTYTFDEFPGELIITAFFITLTFIILPFKHHLIYKKEKFKLGIAFIPFLIMGITTLISAIIRNIFYNNPAFIKFPDSYNIIFGYVGGIAFILIAIFMLLIPNFKTKERYTIENIMYIIGLFLVLEVFSIMKISNLSFRDTMDYGLGWANKNSYMIILEACIPFMCLIFSKNYKRIDALFLAIISIVIGLASDCRTGQGVIGIIVWYLLYLTIPHIKYRKTIYLFSILASIALFFILYFTLPSLNDSINRLFDTMFKDDNLTNITSGRNIIWDQINTYIFSDKIRMFFGGSFSFLFEHNALLTNGGPLNMFISHNTFMTMLAVSGILGVITISYFYIIIIYKIIKYKCREMHAILAFILIGFIHGQFDNIFFYILYMAPLLFILQDYEYHKEKLDVYK